MKPLMICAAALAALALAAAATAQEKRFRGWIGPKPKIECSCRHVDGRAEIGDVVCLRRGSERVLARCEKHENVPFWRVLSEGCEPTA